MTDQLFGALIGAGVLAGLVYVWVAKEDAQVTSQMAGKRLTLASLTLLTVCLSEI